MRAGSLRHNAEVYTRTSGPDEYGDLKSGMVLSGVHKCSMKMKYLQERAANGEILSIVRFDLFFRYKPELETLSPDSEIVINGRRLYVLTAADPTGRRQMVWITAEVRT
jgi:hypothetical protein